MRPDDEVKAKASPHTVDDFAAEGVANAAMIPAKQVHIHVRVGPKQIHGKEVLVRFYFGILKTKRT